ncbi:MAG: hypothetical protein K4571_15910 [Deltaproteobacteria bacterium]
MAKIPIFDIHQAAFLTLHEITPTFTKSGTRVVFEFDITTGVRKLLDQYNQNPIVPLLDYVTHLRRLRSQMLAIRDSQTSGLRREG